MIAGTTSENPDHHFESGTCSKELLAHMRFLSPLVILAVLKAHILEFMEIEYDELYSGKLMAEVE